MPVRERQMDSPLVEEAWQILGKIIGRSGGFLGISFRNLLKGPLSPYFGDYS